MRLLAAAIAAIALFHAGSAGGEPTCPPFTPAQHARAVEEANSKPGEVIVGLDVSGFKEMCLAQPTTVLCRGGQGGMPTIATVRLADAALRAVFEYRSDYVEYGVTDRWRAGAVCGDCEDYALALAERLHVVGVGGKFMWLDVMTTSPTLGHATLLVQTSDAGVVEVSVGAGGEPALYDPRRGFPNRYGSMRLDGRQKWTAEPGYEVRGLGIYPVGT
jgi:predicted transglutaminase-like cysteine proteinase